MTFYLNTKNKTIFAIMIMLIVNTSVLLWISISHLKDDISNHVNNQIKLSHYIVSTIEQKNKLQYAERIKSFITFHLQKKALQSIKQNNRKKLLNLTLPYLKILKNENQYFSTFAFIDNNNNNFLRVHNPRKFGDNVESMRQDIANANKTTYHIMDILLQEQVSYIQSFIQ